VARVVDVARRLPNGAVALEARAEADLHQQPHKKQSSVIRTARLVVFRSQASGRWQHGRGKLQDGLQDSQEEYAFKCAVRRSTGTPCSKQTFNMEMLQAASAHWQNQATKAEH
jgi:hypothetical protein